MIRASLIASALATPILLTGVTALQAEEQAEMIAPTGDVAAGETAFNRQCVACHVVVNDEGEKLAGRNGRTGPNLFPVPYRTAAQDEDFRYGKGMELAGAQGVTWTEAHFTAYVQDPTGFLRDVTEDGSVRSKMSFKVRKPEDAADIFAYLASLNPAPEETAEK